MATMVHGATTGGLGRPSGYKPVGMPSPEWALPAGHVDPTHLASLLSELLADAGPGESIRLEVTVAGPVAAEAEVGVRMEVRSQSPPGPVRRVPTPRDMEFLGRVTSLVEDRIGDASLDVRALARDLHMSTSQLGRKLLALANESPGQLIRRIRIRRAAQLIAQDRRSLGAIAHACGFSDHAHLSRSFRRYFGRTPSDHRRLVQMRDARGLHTP